MTNLVFSKQIFCYSIKFWIVHLKQDYSPVVCQSLKNRKRKTSFFPEYLCIFVNLLLYLIMFNRP